MLVFVLLVSLAINALIKFAQLCFTLMHEYRIGECLVKSYLRQPYSWFLSRQSAAICKIIFFKATRDLLAQTASAA